MMKRPYHEALLVHEASLHLATVQDGGRESEAFFRVMMEIAEKKVYLGYKKVNGKHITLSGIKDFLQNRAHGLGIEDMNIFLSNMIRSSLLDVSSQRNGPKFVLWLGGQDDTLIAPPEYFELRRVNSDLFRNLRLSPARRCSEYKKAIYIYDKHPEHLESIGPGKKWKTPTDCFYGIGLSEKKGSLFSVMSYKQPTLSQIDLIADQIVEALGKERALRLSSALSDRCGDVNSEWDSVGDRAVLGRYY